nr:immunoglobulin light chain junction region [Macaca mulatta]MOX99042.1 immunoglobulin light chain junction region [Macaca mulatta]MOY01184.1 immunoglobulin light chain junction region [Macaca mulatta]
CLQDIQVPYSF